MKKDKRLIFIFVCLILSFVLMIISFPTVLGSINDVVYNFNYEYSLNEVNQYFDVNDIENLYYPKVYTNYYNGTWSFDNQSLSNWEIIDVSGGSINIVDDLTHNTVLNVSDIDAGNSVNLKLTFNNSISSGTLEYWIKSSDCTEGLGSFTVNDASQNMILFYINEDFFYHYDGSSYQILPNSPVPKDDTWYHLRFDFECGSGGYMGLGADEYIIYINGTSFGSYELRNPSNNIGWYQLYSYTGILEGKLDAFSYTWHDNYDLYDNVIPYSFIDYSNGLEKDKIHFYTDDNGIPYNNLDVIDWNDWGLMDGYEEQKKQFHVYTDINNNRVARFYDNDTESEQFMFSKNFSYIKTPIVVMNMSFNITNWGNRYDITFSLYGSSDGIGYPDGALQIKIENDDGNNTHCKFQQSMDTGVKNIGYFEQKKMVYMSIIINSVIGMFNLKVYQDNINIIDYYNLTWCEPYSFINSVHSFFILGQGSNSLSELLIYDLGIYTNDTSLSFTPPFIKIENELNIDFQSDNHNLFIFNTEGYINGSLIIGKDILFNNYEFNNTSFLWNIYNEGFTSINNPSIFFLFNSFFNYTTLDFNVIEISIKGIYVYDSTNSYFLNYVFENVNENSSYFSLDSQNRLNYILNTDDNNTEYIQAIINVNDVSTTDCFISYQCSLNGDSYGTFRSVYTDTSTNIFEIEQIEKTYIQSITTAKTIDYFVIEITDDNENYQYYTSGYITNLQLRYEGYIGASTILLLVSFMIPLLIIIAPSLTLMEIHKSLLLPAFLLLSIISAVCLIIPYWLLFIIVFCFVGFLITDSERVLQFD